MTTRLAEGTTDRTVLLCLPPAATPIPADRASAAPILADRASAAPILADRASTAPILADRAPATPISADRASATPISADQASADQAGGVPGDQVSATAAADLPTSIATEAAGRLVDPAPEVTAARGVTLLAVESGAVDDLAAELRECAILPIGVVGWGAGGHLALALAARRPELVDRLVLVGTPADPSADCAAVTAKTLLLYAAKDRKDGGWYKQQLLNSRYEQVPGPGELDPATMWPRTLSHLAPKVRRSV